MSSPTKSDQTKASIMQAGIAQFTSRGYEGSTLREIAREAGTNMGLIRYHFGTKADLYRDSFAYLSSPYVEASLAALAQLDLSARAEENFEAILFAWLAAPFTHWPEGEIISGSQFLQFYVVAGRRGGELVRGVYETQYLGAQLAWENALRGELGRADDAAWGWWLRDMRSRYFGIVGGDSGMMWGGGEWGDRVEALRELAAQLTNEVLTLKLKA